MFGITTETNYVHTITTVFINTKILKYKLIIYIKTKTLFTRRNKRLKTTKRNLGLFYPWL